MSSESAELLYLHSHTCLNLCIIKHSGIDDALFGLRLPWGKKNEEESIRSMLQVEVDKIR